MNSKYYEFEVSEKYIDSSLIGLTINGSNTNTFPSKTSGYAIDNINCDKDATGEMGPFTDRTYGSQVRQVGSWYEK